MTEKEQIPDNWELKKIEEVANKLVVGFVGPCYSHYCDKSLGVPMIKTGNLTDDGIDFSNLDYVTYEFHNKNKKSQVHKGDILIARHGQNGLACVYDEEREAHALNVIIFQPNQEVCVPKFMYYTLKSPIILEQIRAYSSGTVQDVLNTKALAELVFLYPPLNEQNKISNILDELDSQINTLTSINKKLEKIIQSIFKSWFIDFDGQTEFVDSELGKIPKKFSISNIGNIVCIITGFAFKSEKYYSGENGVKLVRGDNIKRGNLQWEEKTRYWKEITPDLQKYLIMENDVVIGMDGSRVGENFAYVYEYELPLLLVQRVARLRAKEELHQEFTWQCISNGVFTEYVSNIQTGSAIPHISKNQIEDFPILLPSKLELERFQQVAKPMREKISRNAHEIKILSIVRDSLLPKLMSGEIRV